jgi:hypothetical protein
VSAKDVGAVDAKALVWTSINRSGGAVGCLIDYRPANTFCIIGSPRGTDLQIASQLLQRGKQVRVAARDRETARRLLGDRAQYSAPT